MSPKAAGRRVWLYMVDGRNTDDLAQLDQDGFDTWRGHPSTRSGDLVLMYRTAPFSDIAYIFVARSDARRVKKIGSFTNDYAVDLSDGYRLPRTLSRMHLKSIEGLKDWPFLSYARGATRIKKDLEEQGYWPLLRKEIEQYAPGISKRFGRAWTGRGKRKFVFLSYSSKNRRRINEIFRDLRSQGIDVWLDRIELAGGMDWEAEINRAMAQCKAVIVCLSESWVRRKTFVKTELEIAQRYAKERNLPIFPLQIESCEAPPDLQKIQTVYPSRKGATHAFTQLVQKLRDLVCQ